MAKRSKIASLSKVNQCVRQVIDFAAEWIVRVTQVTHFLTAVAAGWILAVTYVTISRTLL